MRFFSGFCLRNEEVLFRPFSDEGDFCVAGFSKGAIDAVEYVCTTQERVDRLQLFSPAFFAEETEAFRRAQLHYFQKNPESYIRQFLQNAAYPSQRALHAFLHTEGKEALSRLLYYPWSKQILESVTRRGIEIEVYLGGRDRIVDTKKARAFFAPFATVYFIKEGGHILVTED